MIHDNRPHMASARLDQMIEFAISHNQEKKKAIIWTWPRIGVGLSGLAMAASVAGVVWLTPATVPVHTKTLANYDNEISDFIMMETFEDLS